MKEEQVRYCSTSISLMGVTLNVYVYLVDGMLVDSGPSRRRREVMDFCQEGGVERIVHTHVHEDHSGNSAYLAERLGVPLYCSAAGVPECRSDARLPLYRRLFWGARDGFEALPLPKVIEGRNAFWEVIPAPGHSPDHVVLLDEEGGRLFSGDLFVHSRTWVAMRSENMVESMETLRRVLRRRFKTVYCSHAGVLADGYTLLQQKLAYLEELQGRALEMYGRGMSISEIQQNVFPKRPPIIPMSIGEWSSYHVLRSLIEDKAGSGPEGNE